MYACPCCGYKTLESDGYFEICGVCFWEDDGIQTDNPEDEGGPNRVSLRHSQANYLTFGACEECFIKDVRPPRSDEERDPDWHPIA